MDLKHPTLAIIGFVESQGPISTIAESQSRWAARIFSKNLKFPNKDIIMKRMKSKVTRNTSVMEDYIEYMNDLAEEYGAKPEISTLFFKDFYLGLTCLTGPFLSYQYRLNGPHKWDEARKTIFECSDRVMHPLSSRISISKLFMNNNKNLRDLEELKGRF
ncbi:dimethylaniline monooxygenase 2 [Caerostris extrusa]|uniref:Flavin-containing monooxygenase n=1 Tax=Caerostris extrusa TaxID=172846 RepID=A0AAV4VX38_CAEEX|nr:dimethylaniline monooxygenase 2 [Caerostris extrusa]